MTEPKQKRKNSPQKHGLSKILRLIFYLFIALCLLGLPLILTYLLSALNFVSLRIAMSIDIAEFNLLEFRWVTLFHIMWIVCGIITAIFYVYRIFVKRYWGWALVIPLHIAMFVVVWMAWLVFNGRFEKFGTVILDDERYHLIQISPNGNGELYLFTCSDAICDIDQIGFASSDRYADASIVYDANDHAIHITADSYRDEIEEMIIPLDD